MIGNRKQVRQLLVFIALIYGACDAQFYFGRNKIQYEEFDWRILKTDHFHIYYYQQEEEILLIGVKIDLVLVVEQAVAEEARLVGHLMIF